MANLNRYYFNEKGMRLDCAQGENKKGEWVKFEDIKEFLKPAHNGDYAKCANYLIGMFDWLQEKVTEQDIVDVLKLHIPVVKHCA